MSSFGMGTLLDSIPRPLVQDAVDSVPAAGGYQARKGTGRIVIHSPGCRHRLVDVEEVLQTSHVASANRCLRHVMAPHGDAVRHPLQREVRAWQPEEEEMEQVACVDDL